ncbi:hypothetical protein GCM10027277_02530 [Pseudoduganella ginsengisoli]|nr:GAF domain-containing protein [Pseudoduganella ginsengisoli]
MTSAEDTLAFFRRLQQLINKIHATHDIDGITPDLSAELCGLLGCDRLTVYQLSADKASLVSKIKTGLAAFKPLKLPVSKHSIAGYAVMAGRTLNLHDVYDESELHRIDPELNHQHGVDRRTGYRAQQMLAVPIADEQGTLLGVLQLINSRHGGPFDALVEEGAQYIADALAIAMAAPARPAPDAQADPQQIARAIALLQHTASQCGITGLQVVTETGSRGETRFTMTGTLPSPH